MRESCLILVQVFAISTAAMVQVLVFKWQHAKSGRQDEWLICNMQNGKVRFRSREPMLGHVTWSREHGMHAWNCNDEVFLLHAFHHRGPEVPYHLQKNFYFHWDEVQGAWTEYHRRITLAGCYELTESRPQRRWSSRGDVPDDDPWEICDSEGGPPAVLDDGEWRLERIVLPERWRRFSKTE